MLEWAKGLMFSRLTGADPMWLSREDGGKLVRGAIFSDPAVQVTLAAFDDDDGLAAQVGSSQAFQLALTDDDDRLAATLFAPVTQAALARTDDEDRLAASLFAALTNASLARTDDADLLVVTSQVPVSLGHTSRIDDDILEFATIFAIGLVVDRVDVDDRLVARFETIFLPAALEQTTLLPFEPRTVFHPVESREGALQAEPGATLGAEQREVTA